MAKTIGTSELTEVWGSDRVGQGAPSIVTPDLGTIEKGFITGRASSNDFTYVSNELGKKINHILKNGVPAWNATTAYVTGNMVTHSNKAWQCLIGNTNSTPADGNANWDKVLTVATPPSLNSILPSQTGNSGRVLTTNGTNTSWANVPFATVNFDGTTAANLTGTFTRSGSTVTVTVTGHGHIVGHRIYFVGAGITSGFYTVATVIDANNFTFTSGTGTITSTACTLQRRSIRKAVNVQSVAYSTQGNYAVNFTTLAPDANYCVATSHNTAFTVGPTPIMDWDGAVGAVASTTAYFHFNIDFYGLGARDTTINKIQVFA